MTDAKIRVLFAACMLAFVTGAWASTMPHKKFNLAKYEREQRERSWRKLCKEYHANRDNESNVDFDIVCFKYREMVP